MDRDLDAYSVVLRDMANPTKVTLDECFERVGQYRIPIIALRSIFRKRARLAVLLEDGPEQLLAMKQGLYKHCLDIMRKGVDHAEIMFLTWHNQNSDLWGVGQKAVRDSKIYVQAVAALSGLPVDVSRAILDRVDAFS